METRKELFYKNFSPNEEIDLHEEIPERKSSLTEQIYSNTENVFK